MSVYFVDTSALAKRYVPEVGTSWLLSWIVPSAGHVVAISDLATVEMFALLARRRREGSLGAENAETLQSVFMLHLELEYVVTPVENESLIAASHLVNRHPLRTLDAIHLASALQVARTLTEPLTFVSADNRLLSVAASEGFAIANPNDHL